MRTMPGVYLAARKDPNVARALMGLSYGQDLQIAHANEGCGVMQPRTGLGRLPSGRWGTRPGALGPHAGLGHTSQVAGTQSINGDAAQRMQAQVAMSGVCNRQAFPSSFGLAGSEAPRMNVMDTPAAPIYQYMATVSGANGPMIVDNGGNPRPMRRAPRPVPITPGEVGKSQALIPWWGAPSIAGAPTSSGVGIVPMSPGAVLGTENTMAPPAFQPQYQPNANDPTEVGGQRIGGAEPPCDCAPGNAGCAPCAEKDKERDAQKFGRGKMAAMLLLGVAAYAFLPKKR